MKTADWIVLILTLAGIAGYGIWKSRQTRDLDGFFRANRQLPWYHILLSVMATQASAITFLSAPGLGYTDGLRFVQFYFGLPLAMIVLCITFVPVFHQLNVFTAYEYLEKRFDLKTRTLTSGLFLLQRGVSNGISIYAPSLVLSAILNLPITWTTVFIGCLVMLYTIYGGTKAVSYTQLLQMIIIFSGLILSAILIIRMMPEGVGLSETLHLASHAMKLDAVDTTFNLNDRYNLWSGIIGGFFLQLSYFGTDQSQVGRYLTGSSVDQSRWGLILNGLIKIPMQFFILLLGVLVFCFYIYYPAPVHFNPVAANDLAQSEYRNAAQSIEASYREASAKRLVLSEQILYERSNPDPVIQGVSIQKFKEVNQEMVDLRSKMAELIRKNDPSNDGNDNNYIFLNFVTRYLPGGMAGLLIAIIFLASMGSLASGLNSLASTTVIDIYKRLIHKDTDRKEYLRVSRWTTFGWGLFCIGAALFAGKIGNLIEAVNILGSLFYGTILGIFVTAFYIKRVKGTAVFIGGLIAEIFVVLAWQFDLAAFLWLNLIGCVLVMGISWIWQLFSERFAR